MQTQNECRSKADIDDDVQRLKEWLLKQPHLPKDIDDKILRVYATHCKSLEIAKRKLDCFCSHHNTYPEYFGCPYRDVLEPAFKDSCNFTQVFFLPEATPDGCRVIMITGANRDKYVHHLFNLRLLLMVEIAIDIWPDMTGIIGVSDAKENDPAIIPKLELSSTVKGLQYVKNSLPLKVKRTIVFNGSKFIEFFVNTILKPLLSAKASERFIISSENEKFLENYFPAEMLPSDYIGGRAPSVKELNDQWLKTLEERRDWFIKLGQIRSDEGKRPPDSAVSNNMDGTFRYLNID